MQAFDDLYGAASNVCQSVGDAWAEVGVGTARTPTRLLHEEQAAEGQVVDSPPAVKRAGILRRGYKMRSLKFRC